jgi:protein-L-isoaspartate(D-aspartate) O-methyltransferase
MDRDAYDLSSSKKKRSPGSAGMALAVFLANAFLGIASPMPSAAAEDAAAFASARRRMVERDLSGRGIKDARVLAAMNEIPRHLFVPAQARASAYDDRPLSIGDGQTISQPYIVALTSELLELKGNEKVLEIGTGSGYQAAVLARLAARVFSIEIIPALGDRARGLLEGLGFTNIEIKIGDGFFGWEDQAPFDAILLTAASPIIPPALWSQLREGGRLVLPQGEEGQPQKLMRYRKRAGKPVGEEITGVIFVPLTGKIRRQGR